MYTATGGEYYSGSLLEQTPQNDALNNVFSPMLNPCSNFWFQVVACKFPSMIFPQSSFLDYGQYIAVFIKLFLLSQVGFNY